MAAISTAQSQNEKFFRYFQHEITDLQEQMHRLEDHSTTGGERSDAVDHCLSGIARLSSEVKDASSYLPAYDRQTYSEAIKALSAKLQDIRSQVAPKPKFSFKSKSFTTQKNESAISLNDAAELASQKRRQVPGYDSDLSQQSSFVNTPADTHSPAPELADDTDGNATGGTRSIDPAKFRLPSFSQSNSVTINSHDGLHIILPRSAENATNSGTISNLKRCVVDMSSPTSTGRPFAQLTLKNIKDSLIICGHVSGPAHITNVSNSIIVVASQQFRMHDSRNCDVYLLASSRPIIEDCEKLHFAPLPEHYMTKIDQQVDNHWEKVDDFKWLRTEPSPHWSPLDMPHRVLPEVWRDVIPGGPGLGSEDILKAVNIPK
ncbi:TBCC-domain-containing protein [Polychaeton citri CBS 116435]|uniref:TBCC-domain-containing protein n=1 Tax=Polychaeton citri CBS 116435 TaxID=1314669 RepID=A0A9P4Q0T3_9PEZI|nr:TBCC-domain-containing protein [Polychaeton citri CBS 116435]